MGLMAHQEESTMPSRRAFTMLEVMVTLAVLGVLAALLALAASDSRRNSGLGHSIANLKRLGVSSFSYAGDNQNLTPTFWWSATEGHSEFQDLEAQRLQGGINSSSAQAIDLIRRRTEFTDTPPIVSWVPHVGYTSLVLLDYLNDETPAEWLASPGDKVTLGWQRGIDLPDSPHRITRRFWSSYELPPAFWGPEGDDPTQRIRQSSAHFSFTVPDGQNLGRRSLKDVVFPAEKVLMYERVQWFFGERDAFFAYPEARIPILFADGSASVRVVGEANVGWDPIRPTVPRGTEFMYAPDEREPATLSGENADRLSGMIRWTRGGAPGRDFGGEEIDTGQR